MKESSAEVKRTSSNTKGCGRPRTTKSSADRGRDRFGRFLSGEPCPTKLISLPQSEVGRRYGYQTIVSKEVHRCGASKEEARVQVLCDCGKTRLVNYRSLLKGVSLSCRQCAMKRANYAPQWLQKRVQAQKQRCDNPASPHYHCYGARGIEFRFRSVKDACLWIVRNLGVDRTKTLDRIDNNGHYEAGNLRWLSIAEQQRNKRDTVVTQEMMSQEWPYEIGVVRRYLKLGLSRQEILAAAEERVRNKRKGWRRIKERLASMTS